MKLIIKSNLKPNAVEGAVRLSEIVSSPSRCSRAFDTYDSTFILMTAYC